MRTATSPSRHRLTIETEEGYAETVKLSYTIREVNDEQPGYTYDSTEYTINVILTDDGAGNILAEIESGNGEAAYRFVNSHTPEPTPSPAPKPSETPKPSVTPEPSATPEPSQKKELPKTGDDNDLGLWVSLMGVALAGMIAVVFTSRRRRTGKHSK